MNGLSASSIDEEIGAPKVSEDEVPGYLELYRRWERQHWSVYELDFSEDRAQWLAASSAERWQWFYLGGFAHYRLAEAQAVDILSACSLALPRPEQRMYVSTQISDEARHVALFERYYREVLAVALPGEEHTNPEVRVSPAYHYLFVEAQSASMHKLRLDPSLENLIESVVLVHIMLEGAIAMASFHVLRRLLQRVNKFPGLMQGMTNTHRDEIRHYQFGVCYLQETLRAQPHYKGLVSERVRELLPAFLKVLQVQPERKGVLLALGLDPFERRTRAIALLQKLLHSLGVAIDSSEIAGVQAAA